METNKIYQGDCKEIMKTFPANCVDLTVTSPPYDNLRNYNGYDFDFMGIADQLFRVTKQGGVVVWVVADATIKGSETGTSFKQALYFKEIGFNLHDTMIWEKTGAGSVGSNLCYWQNFEYMFVFSKGRPKALNLIEDRPNKSPGITTAHGSRGKDGVSKSKRKIMQKSTGRRFNLWKLPGSTHPIHKATFPEKLANDHIISWSNENDIVFDPMCGAGTTLKMAKINRRQFIGIDISEEYVNIAKQRCGITNSLIS